MRLLCTALALACVCAFAPRLSAADYQPNTQEWGELLTLADNTQGSYSNLVNEVQRRIDQRKKEDPDSPPTASGVLDLPRPTMAQLAALLARSKQTLADLEKLNADLKAVKPADRTRPLYLQYLRPLKRASYQYSIDQ